MSTPRGHTKSGIPITDELIEQLADQAERGYDVDEIIAQRARRDGPRLGAPQLRRIVSIQESIQETWRHTSSRGGTGRTVGRT